MFGFWLWFGLWLWLGLWLGSECHVRVLIIPPDPSKECVKVSHVIFECIVINHHPNSITFIRPTITHVVSYVCLFLVGTVDDMCRFALESIV